MIRLDHLASTPVHPEVMAAMRPWLEGGRHGNPSHLHQAGLEAAEVLRDARAAVAALVGAEPEEVIFTSSGTEAANMALCGLAWKDNALPLAASRAEHPAVLETARFLQRQGHPLHLIPVDGAGRIEPGRVAAVAGRGLLAVHAGNHDSGALQDVEALARAAHAEDARVFCDASTSGGWIPLDMRRQEIDLLSLSPHRFFGPQGIGVLVVRRGLELEPLIHGGRQEGGRRAGTESVALAAGAAAACKLARQHGADWARQAAARRDRLWGQLRAAIPGIHLHGPEPGPERDPRHLAVGIEGVEGEALMLLLDLRGVAVTAASGCLSGEEKYSSVLRSMGVPEPLVRGTILMSTSPGQPAAEMDQAASIIAQAVAKLRDL